MNKLVWIALFVFTIFCMVALVLIYSDYVEEEKRNGAPWAENISRIESIEVTEDGNVKLTKLYPSDN